MVERQTERKVKIFRTDNGLEFCSTEFDNFCKSEGIIRHRTTVSTPQQNGVAECMNRTLLERVRSMLSSSGWSRDFWTEATHTACYIINRSPASALSMKTLEEMWTGRPADYSILRIFGCPAYAYVKDGKLNLRAKKCIFIGYAYGVKGYRLWCIEPASQGFLVSRDVTFHETATASRQLQPNSS